MTEKVAEVRLATNQCGWPNSQVATRLKSWDTSSSTMFHWMLRSPVFHYCWSRGSSTAAVGVSGLALVRPVSIPTSASTPKSAWTSDRDVNLECGEPARDLTADKVRVVFLEVVQSRADVHCLAVGEAFGKSRGFGRGDQYAGCAPEQQLRDR